MPSECGGLRGGSCCRRLLLLLLLLLLPPLPASLLLSAALLARIIIICWCCCCCCRMCKLGKLPVAGRQCPDVSLMLRGAGLSTLSGRSEAAALDGGLDGGPLNGELTALPHDSRPLLLARGTVMCAFHSMKQRCARSASQTT
jgi:hypothetical protein